MGNAMLLIWPYNKVLPIHPYSESFKKIRKGKKSSNHCSTVLEESDLDLSDSKISVSKSGVGRCRGCPRKRTQYEEKRIISPSRECRDLLSKKFCSRDCNRIVKLCQESFKMFLIVGGS
jgi:hypothetical protein